MILSFFLARVELKVLWKEGQIIPRASKILTIGHTTAKKARQLFKNEVFVSEEQEEFAFIKFAVESLKYLEVKA